MNEVLDEQPPSAAANQLMGRQGLGLELTNQRSVNSVLTKTSQYDLHPQEIANAGLKVRCRTSCGRGTTLSQGIVNAFSSSTLCVLTVCNDCGGFHNVLRHSAGHAVH